MLQVSLKFVAASVLLLAPLGWSQQPPQQQGTPSVVQPGAPGQPSRQLPANEKSAPLNVPSKADIEFMQGMIMHHGQAVEMTKMLQQRSHDPALLELGKRIDISQTDELEWMKRWLTERGQPIAMPMPRMDGMDMSGMDMSSMMPPMPGMLTPAQMDALKKAREPEFDHLFLTGMIQHHTGALKMVKDLMATPGAAQDPWLFEFTSDVDNTQQAEIDIMRHMLAKEKQ
jgi:uncharacterized protein (DUF305 family)